MLLVNDAFMRSGIFQPDINEQINLDLHNRLTTGLVDFVGIGDSNQVFQGFGWDHGFQEALSKSYNMYATGFISCNENGANGAGLGNTYTFNGSSALLGSTSGAPQDAYLNKGAGALDPHEYAYLDTGLFAWGGNTGLILSANGFIDTAAALEYEVHYGTFDSGSGSFRTAVRLDSSPFTQFAESATVSTNTGTVGMDKLSLALPADAGRAGVGLNGRLTSVGNDIVAPWFGLWQRFIATGVTAGFSYHTLNFRGGESARTMAFDLQQMSDLSLSYYFSEIRERQGATKTIVVVINSGLNDRNETSASVGPSAVADGDSAAAFSDNITAIQNRLLGIWTSNAWPTSELFFVVLTSQLVSDPADAELQAYRSTMDVLASSDPQTYHVNLASVTTEAEMLAESWYNNGGADRNHLTELGYETLSARALSSLGAFTEFGPELVTNGTFDADVSNWTEQNVASVTLSHTGSAMQQVTTTTNGGYQVLALEVGKTYRFKGETTSADVAHRIRISETGAGASFAPNGQTTEISAPGVHQVDFTPTMPAVTVYLRQVGAGTVVWDNISVQEVL